MRPRPHHWLPLAVHLLNLYLLLLLANLAKSDADFESVRIRYDYKDKSGRGGDPVEKYWRKFASAMGMVAGADIFGLCR